MEKKVRELLPIGTIVTLRNGTKRLMIFGIIQAVPDKGVEYDYIGVPYPEGNMSETMQYLFNHEDVAKVHFRGFEDIERQEFIFNLSEFYKAVSEAKEE